MTTPQTDLSRLRISRDLPPAGPSPLLKWGGLLLLVLLVGGGVWWRFLRAPAAVDVKTARVEVSGGGEGGATGITANGYVVARTRASLSSRISGRVVELAVEEGSVVKAGQVLARLESADYVAAVAQAVADSARAEAALRESQVQQTQTERDLARAQALAARDFETRRNVEDLASQLDGAKARVQMQRAMVQSAVALVTIARTNLDNTSIRAPFNGTVLRKDAEVGELVAPIAAGGGLTRGAVVTMASLSTLEVEVDVNVAYIAQIRDQQEARVVLDAYPTASFRGRVRQIVPTADRQRATVQVKVAILDQDPRILPEMGARVDFLAPKVAADSAAPMRVFVPAEAAQHVGSDDLVWVIRDGAAHRTVVSLGPVSGGRREVRAGLRGGEEIVINPPKGLSEGARVNVGK